MENGIDTGVLNCTSKSGRKIIDGVRVRVPAGKAYALLGKDARTKRLVMRLAAANLKGVTLVDDESKLCGLPPQTGKACVFDAGRLFRFMTCREYLRYGCGGFNTEKETLNKRIEGLLETVSLTRRAESKISALSNAEYLCLCVAFSLIIDSNEILINADTLAYGKESRGVLDGLIFGLKAKGKAVLVNLADPRLCGAAVDTAGVMAGGAVIFEGSPAELVSGGPKARFKRRRMPCRLRRKFTPIL